LCQCNVQKPVAKNRTGNASSDGRALQNRGTHIWLAENAALLKTVSFGSAIFLLPAAHVPNQVGEILDCGSGHMLVNFLIY